MQLKFAILVCRPCCAPSKELAVVTAKEGTGAVASSCPTSLKTQCVFQALGPSIPGLTPLHSE
jgi:hypothetical protein